MRDKGLTINEIITIVEQITMMRRTFECMDMPIRANAIRELEESAKGGDIAASLILIGLAEFRDTTLH
ncbi:MAG: hypothetical protein ACYDHY_16060 [Acidiferrobacterales bacterium]